MNIFEKLVAAEHSKDTHLGCMSDDSAHQRRRLHAMATMTGMRGFRVPPLEPYVTPSLGTTRGQRKRARRAEANAKEMARQKQECERLIALGVSPALAIEQFGCLSGRPF